MSNNPQPVRRIHRQGIRPRRYPRHRLRYSLAPMRPRMQQICSPRIQLGARHGVPCEAFPTAKIEFAQLRIGLRHQAEIPRK